MANEEQLKLLMQGVEVWNEWREKNPRVMIDLSESDIKEPILTVIDLEGLKRSRLFISSDDPRANLLVGANLSGANLRHANLSQTNLDQVDLNFADLHKANLSGVSLNDADLSDANLSDADLSGADLMGADLTGADLRNANLKVADLSGATLLGADLRGANFTGSYLYHVILTYAQIENTIISHSHVFGISAWELRGEFKEQEALVITRDDTSTVTVDNVEVAQFIHLILNNTKIRGVLDALTSKAVLILGRFSIPERKQILDTLKNKLRDYNLLPIVFDFESPTNKDFTETIKTLAGMCYFVIADVTNPKSSPLELQATVPDYQIPFVPIIQEGENPFAMMVDLQKKYDWVLKTVTYDSLETLMKVLKPLIIDPAMKKRQELRIIKAQEPEIISGKDYLEKGKA